MGKKASSLLLGCFGKSMDSRPREVTSPGEFASGALTVSSTGVSPGKSHAAEGIEASYTRGGAGTIQPAKEEAWKALTMCRMSAWWWEK